MIANLEKEKIENAVLKVKDEIYNRSHLSKDWTCFSEEYLFAELVSCILGSRVRFETAKRAASKLKQYGLLEPNTIVRNPTKAERRILSELRKQKYQFARAKAKYTVRTALIIYKENNTTLRKILLGSCCETEARDILSKLCFGIGFKQASLFLRNIYYSKNLAILDVHVINYMNLMGINKKCHKTSLTKRVYLMYEKELISYSKKFNTSISRLDVAIWIVMRLIRREFKWML